MDSIAETMMLDPAIIGEDLFPWPERTGDLSECCVGNPGIFFVVYRWRRRESFLECLELFSQCW
jgi:hypothetical protein